MTKARDLASNAEGTKPKVIDAAGDLIYGTGSDAATRLAIGTAGQVLTVNSGATAPEWVTPVTPSAGGDWEYIGNTTGTGVASFAVSGLSGYKRLFIVCNVTSNSSAQMFARINNSSASNYNFDRRTLSRNNSTNAWSQNGFVYNITSNAGSSGTMSSGNTNCFTIMITDCDSTAGGKYFESEYYIFNSSTQIEAQHFSKGIFNDTTAITSMDYVMSIGTADFNVYAWGAN